MSYIVDWFVLFILYTLLHFILLEYLWPAGFFGVMARAYSSSFFIVILFAAVNCMQTFAVAIVMALFARWWLHPDMPSLTFLVASFFPGLIILQLLRQEALVDNSIELTVNIGLALLTAYAAVYLGLRLTLAS